MKKITTLLFLFTCLLCGSLYAQETAPEPDFVGECFYLKKDGSTMKLEKSRTVARTKANAGLYIAGIGKVKTEIHIETPKSTSRIKGSSIKLIVKAVDNLSDPMSIISIFKFEEKKKYRRAEIASAGTFSGSTGNDMDYIDFDAKKYGESSYLLSIENLKPGEYGIIVTNPNNKDEKQVIVSCFGID
ncbi:MAG: hypothetical protein IJ916_09460 [Paludibacteraceae bacterium]|nr:hypothetical protein [Paludibacteraceae bacterium]MEE3483711.1 hypothetical protein [Bacteroidales bacterium]